MTRGMKLALGLWTAFGGSHLVMSHEPIRNKLIDICGSEQKFRGLYSVVSVGTLAPFMYLYWRTPLAQRGPLVLERFLNTSVAKHASAISRALGVFCIVDTVVNADRSPLAMDLEMKTTEPTDPKEIQVC